jgi:aminoglycoside phosphotransferase (APT) family kinase protein
MTVIFIIAISLIGGLWYVDSTYQGRVIRDLKHENSLLEKRIQRLRDAITDIHSIEPDSVLDQYTEPQ